MINYETQNSENEYIPIQFPFASNDPRKKIWISTCWLTIDLIVGTHYTGNITIKNTTSKWRLKCIFHVLLCYLNYHNSKAHKRKIINGLLTRGLLASSPSGITKNVNIWRPKRQACQSYVLHGPAFSRNCLAKNNFIKWIGIRSLTFKHQMRKWYSDCIPFQWLGKGRKPCSCR